MNGRGRRAKGGRVERELVHLMQKIGYKAKRVPLSGAMVGYKSDVIVEVDGKEWSIEVKSRGTQFVQIYTLLKELNTGYLGIVVDGTCIDIATDIDAVINSPGEYLLPHLALSKEQLSKYGRTLKSLNTWEKWLQGSELLAIRGNREPFLFLRYRR